MINILVVEDNEKLRKLVNINLSHAGYNVFEAENGIEALKVIDENNIHLMIVDIMMPEMDGYELTKELREAKIFIPILIVTAKESLETREWDLALAPTTIWSSLSIWRRCSFASKRFFAAPISTLKRSSSWAARRSMKNRIQSP